MNYTPFQLDLISRMGNLSKQMEQLAAENRAAQAKSGRNLLDAAQALTDAIRHSAAIETVFLQHGDLFREFLDTLTQPPQPPQPPSHPNPSQQP